MISNLKVKDFKAVPYLETSSLMGSHPNGLKFSTSKPNVIVGPNGSGKSALLSTLALQTLSYFTGESSFDNQFLNTSGDQEFWSKLGYSWSQEYAYLQGLTCKTDHAPALYYRPGHIPGNETSITHAFMCGYSEEARAYAKLVEKRSSGQQSQSLLERLQRVLTGENIALKFNHVNWSYGKEPRKQDHQSECDYRAKALKKIYGTPGPGAKPLLLMDEPEQSLDARAEALLWKQIRAVDAGRVQVIVASHSLYPLLYPKAFNLIESVPGYIREVQTLTGA